MGTCNKQTTLLLKYHKTESIITGTSKALDDLIRWIKEYRHFEEIDENSFILLTETDFKGCKLKAKMLGCYIIS